jgi:L-fuculose-phosphate aldolase
MQAQLPQTEQHPWQDMVRAGRLMFERGWIAASDGNLTTRLPSGEILATPAGLCKGELQAEDLILCDLNGNKVAGQREPTSELDMHLTVYRQREDVHAVVHAHPTVATGFAAAGRGLNMGVLPEVIVRFGGVPLAAYGTPGTPALGESLLPFVEQHEAVLLANHGAVTWGANLEQAFHHMETVEHFARIALVAELLGGVRPLPGAEIERLFAARERYGVRSRSRFAPGSPAAAEDQPAAPHPPAFTREQLLALIDEVLKERGVH